MALLVDLADELLDIGGDLGLQRAASICRAPSRTISSSSDPPAAPVVFSLDASASWPTLSIRRTFPSRRANADPDQNMRWASILLGRCTRFTSPAEGHPQVPIIALPSVVLQPPDECGDGRRSDRRGAASHGAEYCGA
jgi:hypothetical protein